MVMMQIICDFCGTNIKPPNRPASIMLLVLPSASANEPPKFPSINFKREMCSGCEEALWIGSGLIESL